MAADDAECGTEKLCHGIAKRQPALVIGESFHDMHHAGLASRLLQVLPDQANDEAAGQWQQQPQTGAETFVVFNVTFGQQQALRGFNQQPERDNDAA